VSIGEALAGARRRAGLSVTQVSQRTRIPETIVAGIEGDDYSACGGDFYARGHIRGIAAAVGADPGPLIEQYDAARLGPRARTEEVTEPLTAVPVPGQGRPEPVAPAGMRQSRPAAGPVAPARRRQLRAPAWAVVLGVALVAGLGFAGYLLANTGHAAAPSAGAHRAAPHRAGVGGVVRLRLTRPGRGRYVLLWFTRLPPDPAGTFQASVYSLQLEGRT
jgi:Helix-turn-helix domain